MLLQIHEFAACLEDVQRAMDSGYPDILVHKLHERRGRCCLKLNAYHEAAKSFEKALEIGKLCIAENAKLDQFCKEISTQLMICSKKSGLKTKEDGAPLAIVKKPTPMVTGFNAQMPSFSKAVKINHTEKLGRHGIATRKIECGEIILVEKTDFCFTSLPFRGKICTHCQQPSLGMIPSNLNTKVRICFFV